jgi:acyl-CoA thioesterase
VNITGDFDAHTTPEPRNDGRWTARLGSELSGFGGTHGGYLSALTLHTMASLVADPDRKPRSLTSHLLSTVRPGAVELFPRLERAGGSMTSTSLGIQQDETAAALALASFGAPRASVSHLGVAIRDVPPPSECRPLTEKPVAEARAVLLLVEHRPARPPLPLTGGHRAEIVVWMRLLEDRPVDALSAAMLADAGPPALYGQLSQYIPMPSTDTTLHFADLATSSADRWLLGVIRTSHAAAKRSRVGSESRSSWSSQGRARTATGVASAHAGEAGAAPCLPRCRVECGNRETLVAASKRGSSHTADSFDWPSRLA